MVEATPSSTPEFQIGSDVPIQNHSNPWGTLCPGRIGRVTKLDDISKPLEATCIIIRCGKKASIDWSLIQSNRRTR